jgi:shikimate dehydrogenase
MTEQRVGLIGYPVSHSLSPAMHNAAFRALGMTEWSYDAMEIPPDIVRYGVSEPRQHGYVGINITIPHKQEVMRHCKPDALARAVGAVNTIDFRTDIGTNTDVPGLIEDLKAHDVALKDETVIVLGAGGAARAAVYGLWQVGAHVIVVNRTPEKALEMLTELTLSGGVQGVRVLSLDEAVLDTNASLIINSTPVGMHPNVNASPWPDSLPFREGVTVYDMIYRPAKTRLMQQVEASGRRAIGGLGMLVWQGAAAFEIWTGRPAPIDVMFAAVREALGQKA